MTLIMKRVRTTMINGRTIFELLKSIQAVDVGDDR